MGFKIWGASKSIAWSFLAMGLSGCSLNAGISALLSQLSPAPIQIETIPVVNSDNQTAVPISGTCQEGVPSFTITSPLPVQTVSCVNGEWSTTIDTSLVPDGKVDVVTDLVDPNTGGLVILEVIKDTQPPVVQQLNLNAGSSLTRDLNVNYAVLGLDVHQVYVTQDSTCATGGSWKSASGSVVVSSGEGIKTLYTKARDLAGNESTCVINASITLDQTAPVLTGLSDDLLVQAAKSWSWSCTDTHAPCEYRFSLSQSNLLEPVGSFNSITTASQLSGDGMYYLAVQARDQAGNVSSVQRVSVNLSSNLPRLSIENGASFHTSSAVTLYLSNYVNFDEVDISNDADCVNPTTGSPSATLPWNLSGGEGTRAVYYRFKNTITSESTACYQASIVVDATAPTVSLSSVALDPTNAASIPVVVSFSEVVTGLTSSDVAVINGTVTNFSGSGMNYTFEVVPSGQGLVSVQVVAGAAFDGAGNLSLLSNNLSRTSDNIGPSLSLSSTALPLSNTSPLPIVAAFSEPVTGFTASDIVITNGSLSNFSGSGTSYSFDVTPTADGTITISVAGSVAQDAANNGNSSASLTRTYDGTAPSVVLTSVASDPTNSANLPIVVTFSEAVTGFTDTDLVITNGVLSGFAGSGASYSFTVTASGQGPVSVGLASGVAQDAAGNNNTAAVTLSRVYDSVRPTSVLASAASLSTNLANIPVTVTFSEAVSGFTSADVEVVNAVVSNFSGSGSSYSFDITPLSEGSVTVSVAADVATDAAGNSNVASVDLTRTYDITGPTVSLTSAASSNTNINPIVYTATFSEVITDFAESDLTVVNGTASITGTGPYTISVVPAGVGTVSVSVNANSVTDVAGNFNAGSGTASHFFDNVPPVPPVVTNSGYVTSGTSSPVASWSGATDLHSGIVRYEVAVGTSVGGSDVKTWEDVGLASSGSVTGLSLTAGGLYYVSVRAVDAAGNVSAGVSGAAFRYLVTPTLTAVAPTSGPVAGGTTITLTGTHFYDPMTVTVGGAACGSVSVVSSTSMTCVTPASTEGQKDLVVTNEGGQSGTLGNAFTYVSFQNVWLVGGLSLINAPSVRTNHISAWTGSKLFVWGGISESGYLSDGAIYDPSTDSWTRMSDTGAPFARAGHTGIWTGSELVIWGGWNDVSTSSGGRYNPITNQWTSLNTVGAPSGRMNHTAVWTGSRMIIWGGTTSSSDYLNSGAIYDIATDTWSPTTMVGVPAGRYGHTALWTGTHMLVWGGAGSDNMWSWFGLNSGGLYDPNTNSWTATSLTGAPSKRFYHSAVWTGNRMIVWGGLDDVTAFGDGFIYDPIANSWSAIANAGAPSARHKHSVVWTGSKMIVWGGGANPYFSDLNSGGIYDLATNSWVPTSLVNAPSARGGHTATWIGSSMLIIGGAQFGNTPEAQFSGKLY